MLILPITGDRIETADGFPSVVVSFSNLNPDGPSVSVKSEADKSISTVFFDEILKIQDQSVKLIKNKDGLNVFETDSYIKRKSPLPQVNDIISSGSKQYIINRLMLHVRGNLSAGLIFVCTSTSDDSSLSIGASDIDDVQGEMFSKAKFVKAYADYIGETNELI